MAEFTGTREDTLETKCKFLLPFYIRSKWCWGSGTNEYIPSLNDLIETAKDQLEEVRKKLVEEGYKEYSISSGGICIRGVFSHTPDSVPHYEFMWDLGGINYGLPNILD